MLHPKDLMRSSCTTTASWKVFTSLHPWCKAVGEKDWIQGTVTHLDTEGWSIYLHLSVSLFIYLIHLSPALRNNCVVTFAVEGHIQE